MRVGTILKGLGLEVWDLGSGFLVLRFQDGGIESMECCVLFLGHLNRFSTAPRLITGSGFGINRFLPVRGLDTRRHRGILSSIRARPQ